MIQQQAVQVRAMQPSDAKGYQRVLNSIIKERRYLTTVEPYGYRQVEYLVQDMYDKKCPQFVAISGKEIVGWCDVMVGSDEATCHSGRIGMGLLRAYRGQGAGRKMFTTALQAAREQGLYRIDLIVWGSNKIAIKMYESCGFVIEGCEKKVRYIDGRWDDRLTMAVFFAENDPSNAAD